MFTRCWRSERAAPRSLLLKPASLDAGKNLEKLADFAEIIRPAMQAAHKDVA